VTTEQESKFAEATELVVDAPDVEAVEARVVGEPVVDVVLDDVEEDELHATRRMEG